MARVVINTSFLCMLSLLCSCGAKLKSAGDVSNVFQADAKPLQSHLDTLCSFVKEDPGSTIDFSPFDQGSEACISAGKYAQNYKTD